MKLNYLIILCIALGLGLSLSIGFIIKQNNEIIPMRQELDSIEKKLSDKEFEVNNLQWIAGRLVLDTTRLQENLRNYDKAYTEIWTIFYTTYIVATCFDTDKQIFNELMKQAHERNFNAVDEWLKFLDRPPGDSYKIAKKRHNIDKIGEK
jgi:hypothetical protein